LKERPVPEFWTTAEDCASDSLGAFRNQPAGLRSFHRDSRRQSCNS
jgi:hypothetical protein